LVHAATADWRPRGGRGQRHGAGDHGRLARGGRGALRLGRGPRSVRPAARRRVRCPVRT
jgi:hypothetical protein